MKRMITALMFTMFLCTVALAQTKNVANDTVSATKDTTYVAEYTDVSSQSNHEDAEFDTIFGENFGQNVIIPIVAIVFGCSVPILILFFAFFFRYKNRQAKYKIMEAALKAGQPLPEGLFKEVHYADAKSKGIRNTFTGVGLFVFLWAITGNFGVGSIGLLVVCIGLGQWFIEYQKSKDTSSSSSTYTDRGDNTDLK